MNVSLMLLVASAMLLGLPTAAEVTHKQINKDNSITYVRDDPWQPSGFENGSIVPAVYIASPNIKIDGNDSETDWRRAEETVVSLSHGRVAKAIVKAIYSDEEVFLRVQWRDETENRVHKPWVWNQDTESYEISSNEVEDSLIISFEAGCEWNPSFLAGYVYDFDGWQWLAAQSDPLGQAIDLYGSIQDRDIKHLDYEAYRARTNHDTWNLKFIDHNEGILHAAWHELDRVYMFQPYTADIYYRAVPDGYRPPKYVDRIDAPSVGGSSQQHPSFAPVALSGEAGEVRAKGSWSDGQWTVEFNRDRETPAKNINDTVFNRLIQFSIHIFDSTERIDEASESKRLFLQFRPEGAVPHQS